MKYIPFFFFILFSIVAYSQIDTINIRENAINIYLESVSNETYIKENIKFVNYVRDPKNAEVNILQTMQSAGNGGAEYTFFFKGGNKFQHKNDTLKFFTTADNSNDEIRQKQLRIIKIGLMQYVAHSNLVNDIEIDFNNTNNTNKIVQDKWKSWVFSLSTNVNSSGEQLYKNLNLSSTVSAIKVTEDWKIEIKYSNYVYNEFYYFDDSTIKSSQTTNYYRNLIAKSIGDHISIGFSNDFGNSSFNNKKRFAGFWPTFEYNIFPYSESNIKQFRFQYLVGSKYYKYYDTTIFDKTEELLFNHRLATAFSINKPWGMINTSVSFETYLHDFSKNRLNFDNSIEVRIFKGFSVFLYGEYSIIHDQIYLPKQGMSYEEVLLRQQQNSTSFSYWLYVGLSYTFGSIYNNVVNPRFNSIY